jgi:hypothetical protein
MYKFLNKIFMMLNGQTISLYYYLWLKKSFSMLSKTVDSESVIWVRILPVISLQSILKFYDINKIPFIVNVNDPIVAKSLIKVNKMRLTNNQKVFLETKYKAQAWTFPSSQLADMMAEKYYLDRERCFVIPHAYTPFKSLYKREVDSVIRIVYTGTFYKSAFTDEFKSALKQIQKTPFFDTIEFTFVLSQYEESSIKWIKEILPNVKLKYKLDRSEVLSLIKKSDLMLVVDAETHTELLKGKLVEAISYGIPVFAITYKQSVMDSVVSEYGCYSSYQDVNNDIFLKLNKMIEDLDNVVWLSEFYIKREKVIYKFSEESILSATYDVTEFAFQRFNGNTNYTVNEPYNWP